jgi:hypothetical protein
MTGMAEPYEPMTQSLLQQTHTLNQTQQVDFTNLVFGLSGQWHLVLMVNGQQIRMIKYKMQRNGLLIPAINSPMLQHTVILSAHKRSCVIAHKHTIPKDAWLYPRVSDRIKAGNCNEISRTYNSMAEKTHTFNMTGKNDPKIWYHSRLEDKACHHIIILILVWVLTLQYHKGSKAELYCSYYMTILRAVIMTVFTCHPGQISLYCRD